MEKLLADAEMISGVDYDISSYADIVDAIHVIQTEMGITGTTALEAAGTISGSVASAKSAWSNWLTGLADENADVEQLTNDLVDSVVIAAGNIIPRIGTIAASVLDILGDKAGDMMVKGVEWMSNMAAGIADGAAFVWSEIQRGISEGLARIGDSVESFIQAGKDLVAGMAEGIWNAGETLWNAIKSVCDSALDVVLKFFGIASPSKVMRRLFNFVGDGMVLGLSDKASSIVRTMTGIATSVADAATVNVATPAFAVAGASGNVSYRMNRAHSEDDAASEGSPINIYIDGNLLVGNERIRGSFGVFLDELERMGLM